MNRVLGIVKIAPLERIEYLLDGNLYFNTLDYFVSLENDALRADRKEGDSFWLQSNRVTLSIGSRGGEFLPIGGLTGPIRYSEPRLRKANVFCMYAIGEKVEVAGVNHEVLKFGDTFAVITKPDEFLDRVVEAASQVGQKVRFGPVPMWTNRNIKALWDPL